MTNNASSKYNWQLLLVFELNASQNDSLDQYPHIISSSLSLLRKYAAAANTIAQGRKRELVTKRACVREQKRFCASSELPRSASEICNSTMMTEPETGGLGFKMFTYGPDNVWSRAVTEQVREHVENGRRCGSSGRMNDLEISQLFFSRYNECSQMVYIQQQLIICRKPTSMAISAAITLLPAGRN